MTRQNKYILPSLLTLSLLALPGCDTDAGADETGDETGSTDTGGDGDGDGDAAVLKLRGQYTDEFGGEHTIDSSTWVNGSSSYAISQFDNAGDYVIAQNGSANEFNPDLWSRFDLAFVGTAVYYCQTGFGEASEADALALARPDDSDPASTGCGGEFAWSLLAPEYLEIQGDWTDDFDGAWSVAADVVTSGAASYAVSSYDGGSNFMIAQNDAGNDFNPDLWSRFDWTYDGNDLWICQTAFDAADEQTAIDTPAADPSDPANAGCGDFSWSKLN